MVTVELTNEDATFLASQLASRLRHVEDELVHTDARALQAELADDRGRLERLRNRLVHAITLAESQVAV